MEISLPVCYTYSRCCTNANTGTINFSEGHTAPFGVLHLLQICSHSETEAERKREFLLWFSVLSSSEGSSFLNFKPSFQYGYGKSWTTPALNFLNISFCFMVIMFRIFYQYQQLQIYLFMSCSCVYISLYQLNLNQFTQYVRSILCYRSQIYRLKNFTMIALDLQQLQQIKLWFTDFTQQLTINLQFF